MFLWLKAPGLAIHMTGNALEKVLFVLLAPLSVVIFRFLSMSLRSYKLLAGVIECPPHFTDSVSNPTSGEN